MRRVIITWAVALAGVVALWAGGVSWLNATVYSPQALVTDYLEALEDGDVLAASAIAGLEATPAVSPVAEAKLTSIAITGVQDTEDNRVLIRAEYLMADTAESSVFTLSRQGRVWGLFDQWEFSLTPTATIETTLTGLDRVIISGLGFPTEGSLNTTVLVPGSYTVEAKTQWLETESYTAVVSEPASVWSVDLRAQPTSALLDEVNLALTEYLGECAMREVLQPSSCPFGVQVTDRLYTLPEWSISQVPAVSLAPTNDDGTWDMVALGGRATIDATLQSLFDGSLRSYSEVVSFGLTGDVTGIDSNSPALRID
ncbi:membrane protein YvbJ [Pontimonas salivibrio]|uniref:Membrane protein YvbJ n=1 Tax=Pontimonas salivibrio TaxID=1159327 RepID=A0A2L2BN77_9MICO|nr:hypothetical protein [Pontimonas salivibrio]AVG23123.1 membrane protein YvbJ [Pontimonas salivibrio]